MKDIYTRKFRVNVDKLDMWNLGFLACIDSKDDIFEKRDKYICIWIGPYAIQIGIMSYYEEK